MRAWTALLSGWALLEREIEQQLKRDAGLSHTQYKVPVRPAAAPDRTLRMTVLAVALLNSKSRLTYQWINWRRPVWSAGEPFPAIVVASLPR